MFLLEMFQIPQMFLPEMFQIPQMFARTCEYSATGCSSSPKWTQKMIINYLYF